MNDALKRGDLAEIKFAAKLAEKYTVLSPFSKNSRYDLAFENNDKFYRVQVKHGTYRKGCVVFSTRSYCAFTKVSKHYTSDEIDFFGIWCSELDKYYLVPVTVVSKGACNMRVDSPKVNQPNIRWAKDFEV